MPAELLRGVVEPHPHDAPPRWSVLPLSITVHLAAALAMVIIPLAAEVELPTPQPLTRQLSVMPAKTLPPPPAARRSSDLRPRAVAAPLGAPEGIAKEDPVDAGPADPGVPGSVGVTGGVMGGIGEPLVATPLLPPPPPPPAVTRPLRPGGGIREPQKVIHVAPVYPAMARGAGVQGVVILEAVINQRGEVENVRVLRSNPLLEGAAVEAVKQWRYTPTLLNGVPVPVLITITVHFTMQR